MDTNQFMALCDGIAVETTEEATSGASSHVERIKIKDALIQQDGKGTPYADFRKLHTAFIYLSVIDSGKDYSPYYYILEKVREHFNGATRSITDWSSQAWKDVIAYCKSLPEYPKTDAFLNEFMYVRERRRATAAKNLESRGAKVSVQDNNLTIENLEPIYEKIEDLMTEIGGIRALDMMLAELPYRKEIGRFLVPHQGNQPMITMVDIETPYGYLYNLCLKHLNDKGVSIGAETKWAELKDLAKDICLSVFDSQKFDLWNDIILQGDRVVPVVHELVIRFGLYTLPQTNVSFALDWCRYLCKFLSKEPRCCATTKQMLRELQQAMNCVMDVAENDKCVVLEKGSKRVKYLESKLHIIGRCIMERADRVNTGYARPDDIDKVNAMKYPIIERDEGYVILPKPLGVWSWYEAIFNIMRPEKILSKELGVKMEDFIRNKMMSHGLASHTGKYKFTDATGAKVEGEVDFLIESDERDVVMESKKKALSQPARSGDDYYIWGDLSEMIYSQMQCAKLETAIKKHGPVDIHDEKRDVHYTCSWREKTMEGKDRTMVKASMTLKEYGPMQDKLIMDSLFRTLLNVKLNATFSPTDTVHNADDQKSILEAFDKINKAIMSIRAYYAETGEKNPTFFCRFYSMEQVYFMIKIAKGQEHFTELLRGTCVSTGTENFWNEYLIAQQMN